MKSLMFGVYGEFDDSEISRNIQLFGCQEKREITEFKTNKLSIFFHKGSTDFHLLEVGKYVAFLSGDININLENVSFELDMTTVFNSLKANCIGHFTIGLYDKQEDVLLVSNDAFGLYPLFYRKSENYFMFSNEYQPLVVEKEKLLPISVEKLTSYFDWGFTLPGTTFWKEIKMLRSNQRITVRKNKIKIAQGAPLNSVKFENYNHCLSHLQISLKKAVDELFSKYNNTTISITGGLDSRMILGFTDESIRSKENYFTFYLSPLDETNDNDVLIGKMIADQYQLNHTVIPFQEKTERLIPDYFNNIRQDNNAVKITGQYGGELLSGILYTQVLSPEINNIFRKFEDQKRFFFNNYSTPRTLRKEAHRQGKRKLYFEILTSGFFTSIYGGSEGSWVHPWMNSLRYFSPFLDYDFLKVWLSIPDEYLFNNERSLYFDLFSEYLPEMKIIPTNSKLKGLAENGFKSFEIGIEPKSIKERKSTFSYTEIEKTKGFLLIPDKYKTQEYISIQENQQRLIDFCNWYAYYDSLLADLHSEETDNQSKRTEK